MSSKTASTPTYECATASIRNAVRESVEGRAAEFEKGTRGKRNLSAAEEEAEYQRRKEIADEEGYKTPPSTKAKGKRGKAEQSFPRPSDYNHLMR
jgi:hypothetical protein